MNQKKPSASIGSSLNNFLIEQGIIDDARRRYQTCAEPSGATKTEITSDKEYEQALALMDKLVDNDGNQQLLIEHLTKFIEQWENTSPKFARFNQRINADSE